MLRKCVWHTQSIMVEGAGVKECGRVTLVDELEVSSPRCPFDEG